MTIAKGLKTQVELCKKVTCDPEGLPRMGSLGLKWGVCRVHKEEKGLSPCAGGIGTACRQEGLQFCPKVTSRGLKGNFGILCYLWYISPRDTQHRKVLFYEHGNVFHLYTSRNSTADANSNSQLSILARLTMERPRPPDKPVPEPNTETDRGC